MPKNKQNGAEDGQLWNGKEYWKWIGLGMRLSTLQYPGHPRRQMLVWDGTSEAVRTWLLDWLMSP